MVGIKIYVNLSPIEMSKFFGRPTRSNFFGFFFHVKLSIVISTIVTKKKMGKMGNAHELFTKTYF